MLAIKESTKELLSVVSSSNDISVLQNAIKTALSCIEESTNNVDIREVFSFNELSENVKEKVLDNFRYINVEHEWYDCELDDFATKMKSFGFYDIETNFSGFHSQGDGASFTTNNIDLIQYLKATKQLTAYKGIRELINDGEVQLQIKRNNHHYYHSNTVYVDCSYISYSTSKQEEIVSKLMDNIQEFVRRESDYLYKELNDLYDTLTSNEEVKECIIANEYQFDINGNQIL